MLLGLVTCANLPGWEKDDIPFQKALEAEGLRFEQPIWDDPDVDWAKYDACLIRTTWDYMEKLPAFLAWVDTAGCATQVLNPPNVIRWNSAKTYLRELAAAGIPIAPTVWFEPGDTANIAHVVQERGWSKAFLKPVVGLCAWETLRFRDEPAMLIEAQEHLARNLETKAMMLQPYLSRVETVGEYSSIYFDGVFSHAVQKTPVPGDYRVQDDFGASDRPIEASSALLEISERVLQVVTGILGDGVGPSQQSCPIVYARMDFLENDDGDLVVNEVELIEPSLFFRHSDGAGPMLARVLAQRLA